ncbi:MAG: peptidylprolyl isomerase [Candidatus Krumholzibacteriales bacterium]
MSSRMIMVPVLAAVLCSLVLPAAAAGQDSTSVKTESGQKPEQDSPDSIAVIRMEDGGIIKLELMPDKAPLAVARIRKLIKSGFYDGLEFHRVESYLVQTGKKDHQFPPVPGEMFSQYIKHTTGMVGMARLPNDYDSATTQFYICKKEIPSIDGEYTMFARVVEGMDVVQEIEEGDRIESCLLSSRN